MNSQEFKSAILIKRPRYATSRVPVFEVLANKGSRTSEYSQFGPLYELYIYAFMVGLKTNQRLPLPPREFTSDFLEIGKWKRDSGLIDFILMVIFTRDEEIGFDWNELEDMDDGEINVVISKVITFLEEYANGGLHYIQQLLEKGELQNNHYLFVELYKSVANQVVADDGEDDSLSTLEDSVLDKE